jgi:hypothetical protein
MKRLRGSSNLVFVVLGLATASVAAGCGAGSTSATGGPAGVTRSATAYCSYFYGEGAALRERFIRASEKDATDPVAGLASVFADLPEAASFMHQLALRAPDEIAPQLEALARDLEGATPYSQAL